MRIFFSGIGGVGIGPLAEIALDAGHDVVGSDVQESALTKALEARGASVFIGQSGEQIELAHTRASIDWFVYTAALREDHPELQFAKSRGIRATKRDELLAQIIKEKNLKLIAVSGTHGKTTTTGMLIWVLQQLSIPLSYSVGTVLSYGASGHFDEKSEYFVYECDEFDRNILHFYPNLSLITSLDYDHFDTYPTLDSYKKAFVQFIEQSDFALLWEKDLQYLETDIQADSESYDEHMNLGHITLAGDHNRHNAYLVERAITRLFPDAKTEDVVAAINSFPGTGRRFEKLAENLYTDYGHHPVEIAATIQLARELNDHVVVVYQPHQNVRQHEVKADYKHAFDAAERVYWLPTYLTREQPDQAVLSPDDLIAYVSDPHKAISAELNDDLFERINQARAEGALVLVMGAGPIDGWIRSKLADQDR